MHALLAVLLLSSNCEALDLLAVECRLLACEGDFWIFSARESIWMRELDQNGDEEG